MTWTAVAVFALAASLMVALLLTRLRAIRRERRTAKLVSIWREIFTGAAPNVPRRIRRRDAFTILNLWNDFHRVRTDGAGVSVAQLEEVARVQQFGTFANRMLRWGDVGDRIVALNFIGYLRDRSALPRVRRFLNDTMGEVSLAAHRALVLIDHSAMNVLAFEISRRDDWPRRAVELLLREIGSQGISRPLAITVEHASNEHAIRLLRFFVLCDPLIARTALRKQLQSRVNPDVLAAALRSLTSFVTAEDRELIRGFLRHRESFVRIAAIVALGTVCIDEDRQELLRLLTDPNAWVRYRAAQALLDCATHEGELDKLTSELADRFARDALKQVLAERSVLSLRQFVVEETAPGPPVEERVARLPLNAMRLEA
jgi:hypothetical protein